jgi:hypothetical protein
MNTSNLNITNISE